jgi:hypothetical protein
MKVIALLLFVSGFLHVRALASVHFSLHDTCKVERDSLTGRRIFKGGDIQPECLLGAADLLRLMNKKIKVPASELHDEIEFQFVVAFIVEANGDIGGGRVIRGNKQVGKQMLQVAKSLKWSPGKCGDKSVPMIYKLSLNVEYAEQ